ncbi:MAG: response regulator, partial [Steroidobacter sp.]
MMQRLSRLPIRGKLMLLAGIVTAVALLICGAVLVYYAYAGSANALRHRLETQAKIMAISSAAALTFDDVEAAQSTIEALAGDSAILAAEIVRADGSRFIAHEFGSQTLDMVRELDGVVHTSTDIVLDERIGEVRLWATTAELGAMLVKIMSVLTVAAIASLLAALLAASRLQRIISTPILALARTASAVSKSRDYSLRVTARSQDEVGQLVGEFNDMLAQIETQAGELRTNQLELEEKVESRTAELAAALRDAQAAARAKAEFLANMSHEIRTPMNGVIGMLDLMEPEQLDPQRRSMLETARNSAEALLGVINDVLDFSKIDAGKLTLEHIDVELASMAEEVATLFARQAQGKDVEVTCLVESSMPAVVRGDPTRLRQILANLLGNAIKFTERGDVCLTLRGRETGGAAGIEIIIADTGIGMSSAAVGNLFQSFSQADSSTTRRFGGTGLGLAISKRLIDAMGGSIAVVSEPGKGSTFTVTLPLAVSDAGSEKKRADLSGLKVLIVDDNATNRRVLEHYLKEWNVQSASSESVREGLEVALAAAAASAPFDLVLLDYHMPDADGLEFVRRMRADPRIARTHCLVLSSLGDRAPGADTLGVAAWLNKPLRRGQIHGAIAMATGLSSSWERIVPSTRLARPKFDARVLLVEDNIVNQQVATRLLATFGITPQIASDGLQSLERVRTQPYDLVLMDCQMPVMDGYQATRGIREFEHAAGRTRTPIIAMTANAMQGD